MGDKRLIDANALKVRMFRSKEFNCETGSFDLPVVPWRDIEDADTIDAVEVVQGRWVDPCINKYGHPCHHCSACRFKASQKDRNFCPNCGAKMDGGAEG